MRVIQKQENCKSLISDFKGWASTISTARNKSILRGKTERSFFDKVKTLGMTLPDKLCKWP